MTNNKNYVLYIDEEGEEGDLFVDGGDYPVGSILVLNDGMIGIQIVPEDHPNRFKPLGLLSEELWKEIMSAYRYFDLLLKKDDIGNKIDAYNRYAVEDWPLYYEDAFQEYGGNIPNDWKSPAERKAEELQDDYRRISDMIVNEFPDGLFGYKELVAKLKAYV